VKLKSNDFASYTATAAASTQHDRVFRRPSGSSSQCCHESLNSCMARYAERSEAERARVFPRRCSALFSPICRKRSIVQLLLTLITEDDRRTGHSRRRP
jgi:hypothetical protein